MAELDYEPFPDGNPHDIKRSHITGDLKCRLCLLSYPLDEPCEAPMATFTIGDVAWVVVLSKYESGIHRPQDEKHVVRFYDRRQAGKPGFNGQLGQYVSEYFADSLVNDTPRGLTLYGGVPEWRIDLDTMGEIIDWVTHTEYWQERGA